jgi:hypothetical protein
VAWGGAVEDASSRNAMIVARNVKGRSPGVWKIVETALVPRLSSVCARGGGSCSHTSLNG